MPKIKVKENFYDRENDLKLVVKDTEMEVSDERAKKLVGLGLAEIVEETIGEKEPKKPTKTKSKKGDVK